MTNRASDKFLEVFTKNLKSRSALPKKIEISRLGNAVLAGAFDTEPEEVISDSVFSGMDPDPAVAILKALVEKCERAAFLAGFQNGNPACQTDRSDGFAAFPIGVGQDPQAIARRHAFHEAVERYVWAKWWDEPQFSHTLTQYTDLSRLEPSLALLRDLNQLVPLKEIYESRPKIQGRSDLVVVILFALCENGGLVSGGACEHPRDLARARFRAIAELSRHALAARKIITEGRNPMTFYERRLMFFAADLRGAELALKRIAAKGSQNISLPELDIDTAIPHELDDLVNVHRCLFKDQPPFVGGSLERLCL